MPAKAPARSKPELADVESELMDTIMKDVDFKKMMNITGDATDTTAAPKAVVWDKYGWIEGRYLDSNNEEETMEMNEGEKKMAEKMKAKGKITARDLEFQRKFALKKRQVALRALSGYARSLT